jgi:hypothetical protein
MIASAVVGCKSLLGGITVRSLFVASALFFVDIGVDLPSDLG